MWLFQDNATLKIYVALMNLGKEVKKTRKSTKLGVCCGGDGGEGTIK